MEELFGVVWVIIMIVAAVSNAAKKKNKAQEQYVAPAAAAQSAPTARTDSMASMLPSQQATPAVSMQTTLPETPVQVAQPTVHTHLEPDCETHDAPESGSLGAVRTEGRDPCHEEQLVTRRAVPAAVPETSSGLKLDWSADAMVNAFVMQEILTRPAQRRTR